MASGGNMLPSPALTDKNGEYIFNQTGVDAIKSELVNGRAVSIAFYGDQSAPGQIFSVAVLAGIAAATAFASRKRR